MGGSVFRKCIYSSGMAEDPPKMGLASGLLCLRKWVSFLKEGFSFDCTIWWEGCHFLFYTPSPKTLSSYCNLFLSNEYFPDCLVSRTPI